MIKKPTFGYHASIDRGYLSAVQRPIALKAGAVQLWMGNSKGYASKLLESKIYTLVRDYVIENGLFLIAHSPYILNFARPLQETPAGNKALERYLRDLVNVTNLGGIGSILHMGSNVKELKQTNDEACTMFAKNLQWIVERMPHNATIILENMAGGGTQICCNMNDMVNFWQNHIPDSIKSKIKWCIDTAHLYANGEYDISETSEVLRFYNDFDNGIGWENLLCFHFNGSKTRLKSHKDNHADIGPEKSGFIKTEGLIEIAKICGSTDKFMILEVPTDEYNLLEQFDLIESWFEN